MVLSKQDVEAGWTFGGSAHHCSADGGHLASFRTCQDITDFMEELGQFHNYTSVGFTLGIWLGLLTCHTAPSHHFLVLVPFFIYTCASPVLMANGHQ